VGTGEERGGTNVRGEASQMSGNIIQAATTAMNDRTVTVLGGTGFLGRRVVRHLRKSGFPVRIASRHPERGSTLFGCNDPQLQSASTLAVAGFQAERLQTNDHTGVPR
jgi:hypothetical protein